MTNWIKTNKRLPPKNLDVLVYFPDGEICILYYNGFFWVDRKGYRCLEPEYWQKLQKPIIEDQDD